MLYSYFRLKDKHYKTLKLIKKGLNTKPSNLPKKRRIKRLNEYQYFYVLNDLNNHYPIENLTLDELKVFFAVKKVMINYKHQAFSQGENVDDFIPVYADFVSFNYNKSIDLVVKYFFETKEYPQETLITKLLVLSDKIFELVFDHMLSIKVSINSYIESNKTFENDEKYSFLLEILFSLNNNEKHLLELTERIQNKIKSLSKTIATKKENYLIDTDDRVLEKLYFGLEKFMYLDQNKTSLSQFIEVLKLDWESHNSVIYLEMDNIQFKYFIDCFNQFLKTKIPLTFIERAQNIKNTNGVIKASSIRASYSRAYGSVKDFESLRSIFENL